MAWVHSPLIPLDKRGTTYDGLVHITDWRVTYAGLAGVEPDPGATMPLDGHDVWEAITTNSPSPRTEVVHNVIHVPDNNKTCSKNQQHDNIHPWCGAAIRVRPITYRMAYLMVYLSVVWSNALAFRLGAISSLLAMLDGQTRSSPCR